MSSDRCSGSWIVVNGVGQRAPSTNWTDDVLPIAPWLEVPGHEDCIGRNQNGQACLPATRPPKCIPPSWETLQEMIDKKCPNQDPIPGIPPPPGPWDVPGHNDCVRIPKFPNEQPCLPATRPPKCIPPDWEKLQQYIGKYIEKCPNPIPIPNFCPEFKEAIKGLKDEMLDMKMELTREIKAQSKKCRPTRYGKWNQYRRPANRVRHKHIY